jgi:hypothetical protein
MTDTVPTQVLVDLDGLLIDMSAFGFELADAADRGRWLRFFEHTGEAKPVLAGQELVAALHRLRWRYSISTTRPRVMRTNSGAVYRPAPMIRWWVKENLVGPPRWIYFRDAVGSPVGIKTGHFYATAAPPMPKRRARPAALFIDDEHDVVDALCDHGLPAVHVDELAGMGDDDLKQLLTYSAGAAQRVHREYACRVEVLLP